MKGEIPCQAQKPHQNKPFHNRWNEPPHFCQSSTMAKPDSLNAASTAERSSSEKRIAKPQSEVNWRGTGINKIAKPSPLRTFSAFITRCID
jgi:hypothetical protein